MNTKIYSKVVAGVLAVAIAVAGIFAMPTATYAQGTNPPTTPTAPGKPNKDKAKEAIAKGFEKQYERVVKNAKELKAHLDKANDVVKKAQDFIAERKSKGIDTAAAEAALTAFTTQLKEAQASYDEAKKILDAHAGFDADGKVTDREAAKDTLLNSAKALREGQKTLTKAVREVQKAIKEIRKDKKDDAVKPTATPTP